MNQRRLALWMIAVCMGAQLSLAQQTPEQSNQEQSNQEQPNQEQPKPKRKIPAAFEPPEVNESLPDVLLLGDSISIGYMLDVRKQLSGQANVWRPAANCGPTTRGLESLEKWIGDRKWDLIHFNFGLHDLKFLGPAGQNFADPTVQGSHYQVPIEQYRANLSKIAKRLKATGATVIWCETTPVPKGANGRISGDAKQYNEVAAQVMQKIGEIQINHLYDFARNEAEQKQANVHYTPAGSAKLAEQVSKTIQAFLASDS